MSDTVFRMVGAMIHCSDRNLFVGEPPDHPAGQQLVLRFVIIAPAYTSLICNNYDGHSLPCRNTAKFENSVDEFEILGFVNVLFVDIDDAVPVKKQCRSADGLHGR